MYRKMMRLIKAAPFIFCLWATTGCAADNMDQSKMEDLVSNAIRPVMSEYEIPGMAIAITVNGERYFYNYGVASKETGQPVTNGTIFEIGSISKTFTATLASYAEVNGKLTLADYASQHLPALSGSSFDNISLLHLGTHTPGGLPLQIPDDVRSVEQLMAYYRNWTPTHPTGAYRKYSNPSIGMLGMIAAKSMNESFETAVHENLFSPLQLTNSYYRVPENRMKDYAQGYNKQDDPVRLKEEVLMAEAYGVKSGTADLIRFIEANMGMLALDEKLQRAIVNTHTGYYKAGEITQDLIWEQYPYPVTLEQLQSGNASKMVLEDVVATEIIPPLPPSKDVWINKTGSTNGFGAYVAFIPAKEIGIVILANKPYSNEAKAAAAFQIMTQIIGLAP